MVVINLKLFKILVFENPRPGIKSNRAKLLHFTSQAEAILFL